MFKNCLPVRLHGASCSVCRNGVLEFEGCEPTRRPLGHSKRYFRCTKCKSVHVETVDTRLLGELGQGPTHSAS
jgi:hypothetical protein